MKFDRSRMKSGFSLAAMVICMSLLASVVGYFLGSWMIEYVTAPEDGIQNVSSEKVVLEEKINTSKLEEKKEEEQNLNNSNTAQTSTLNSQPEVRQGSDNLFVVQVGAFNNQNNATRLVKKLKSIGYSAYITSQNPYKVQVGAFETEEAAAKLGRELKEDGFPVFISH
ncbi:MULTISPECIES: SPOR domain-containing protein [unclassified Candidatus Frackibacter]|nr:MULTISPECIES: SPOR domain-containing protein [unclassified Candidatus Frackibacter]SDC42012.1 Sporulation related domain-containing protein [Candidatus Frackibacter sp. WG11]SFL63049.1 Sporulation related domain-containing protein [Candidatus Frackibacter sp. WG13]